MINCIKMYEIKFSMFFIIFVIAKIVGERIMLEIKNLYKTNNKKSNPIYTGNIEYKGEIYEAKLKAGRVVSCSELSKKYKCDIKKLSLSILSKNFESLLNIDAISIINTLITEKRVLAIFCVLELIIVSLLILFTNGTKNIYHSKKVKLTDNLEIPAPVGDGQYRYSLVVAEKRL